MTEPKTITAADLWTAVDRIFQPRHVKLPNDGIFQRSTTLPSLWQALAQAVDKNTGDAGNGKQQSRPPLNTDAISLQLEIARKVRDERRRRNIGSQGLNTHRELRAVVRDVIDNGDTKVYPDVDTSPTWWPVMHKQINSWASRIKTLIDRDTMRLHSAACRVCKATTVPAFNSDGSENGRQPALVVHFLDGEVNKVVCDMCGETIDDAGLNKLWHDARAEAERARAAADGRITA